MALPQFKPYRFALLTGAGFSYPFGGRLASELWDVLFRNKEIQKRSAIRELLLDNRIKDRGFEQSLATVRKGSPHTQDDLEALEDAIVEAFTEMDDDMADIDCYRDSHQVNASAFQEFLQLFQCPKNSDNFDSSFIFTLNQDLMVERKWYRFDHLKHPPSVPGVTLRRQWFRPDIPELDDTFITEIPTDPVLSLRNQTNYIKLHGSFNWRTTHGRRALVVGGEKPVQIEGSPLLKQYAEVFRHVLEKCQKLLIIGYSFQDSHINETIGKAVLDHDLELYIWDPFVDSIIKRIFNNKTRDCKGIIQGVKATYSMKMHEVFPDNQFETSEWKSIRSSFFEI